MNVTCGVQEPLCCERYLWCAGAASLCTLLVVVFRNRIFIYVTCYAMQEPYRRVHYELVDSDDAKFFLLDATSGQLRLRSSLLYDPDLSDVYDVRVYI